jgi:predicted acetyltransferase
MNDLRLVRPQDKFKRSYLAALQEFGVKSEISSWVYLGDDEPLDMPSQDFAQYVVTLLERETKPAPHFVPNTTYWAEYGGEIVGRISIRHELNDFLKNFGGHVGYIVRPSYQRRGFASEMLRQVLQTERAKSIGKLLVTCDEGNIASERTILKNNGIFEGLAEISPDRPKKKRFWIQA